MTGLTGRRPFDHHDAGTAEEQWQQSRLRSLGPLSCPAAGDRLVVVSAHPDDETLGAGGLIATAAAAGAAVTVLVATDGERSHPDSPTHSPEDLATRRRREVRRAVRRLAPGAEVRFLGLPDGSLAENTTQLVQHLRRHTRRATHLVTPWVDDAHPDHEACARAGREALRGNWITFWQYPIWAWHWADPDGEDLPWDAMGRLTLGTDPLERKAAAVAEHVSQHAPLSPAEGDERLLHAAMLAHFQRPYEAFVVDEAAAVRPGYFEDLYAAAPDPWGLADRFYEQRKRALLLASLPRQRFSRAFEPGCATGLTTAALTQRCDSVVAWDVAAFAVEQTRRRVGDGPVVTVARRGIPVQWPAGSFDLVVLGEVGYYCPDLDLLVRQALSSLTDDGVVAACHWRHPAPDHPHTAEDVHRRFDAELPCLVRHEEEDFLLAVWSREGRSVAHTEGVLT